MALAEKKSIQKKTMDDTYKEIEVEQFETTSERRRLDQTIKRFDDNKKLPFNLDQFTDLISTILDVFESHDYENLKELLPPVCDAIDQYPYEAINEIEKTGLISKFTDNDTIFDISLDYPKSYGKILFIIAHLIKNSKEMADLFKESGFLESSVHLITHEELDVSLASIYILEAFFEQKQITMNDIEEYGDLILETIKSPLNFPREIPYIFAKLIDHIISQFNDISDKYDDIIATLYEIASKSNGLDGNAGSVIFHTLSIMIQYDEKISQMDNFILLLEELWEEAQDIPNLNKFTNETENFIYQMLSFLYEYSKVSKNVKSSIVLIEKLDNDIYNNIIKIANIESLIPLFELFAFRLKHHEEGNFTADGVLKYISNENNIITWIASFIPNSQYDLIVSMAHYILELVKIKPQNIFLILLERDFFDLGDVLLNDGSRGAYYYLKIISILGSTWHQTEDEIPTENTMISIIKDLHILDKIRELAFDSDNEKISELATNILSQFDSEEE